MIDSKTASKQIERLKGLNFFPSEPAAIKELRLAAECAASEAILRQAVDTWLGDTTTVRKESGELASASCPKPAELRRIIYGLNEVYSEKLTKCPICHGSGSITVWRLVTYAGNGFQVKSSEPAGVADYESAMILARKLAEFQVRHPKAERQMVVTSAASCSCTAPPTVRQLVGAIS